MTATVGLSLIGRVSLGPAERAASFGDERSGEAAALSALAASNALRGLGLAQTQPGIAIHVMARAG